MTPLELRPLAIGELLDRVFTLYRRHLSTFVGIMAIPAIFSLALALLLVTMQHLRAPLPLFTPDPSLTTPADLTPLLAIVAGYIVAIVAYWIGYMLALGATTVAVSEIYAGGDLGIGQTYVRARQRIGRLMLLGLLWCLLILGPGLALVAIGFGVAVAVRQPIVAVLFALIGALALLATFVFLSLRFAVSVPALMLEGASARASLQRSTFLTRGFLGRVFLVSFCGAMLSYTAVSLFQMPFNTAALLAGRESAAGFWLQMAGVVCGTIGQTLTAPVMVIGIVVLYYDLRVRKEALDLQMMIGALDVQPGGLPIADPASPAIPN